MDGFELLGRLRTTPRLAGVPVIMLTGLGGEVDIVRGLGLGANDYMVKPFSPAELLARVRRYVPAPASGASTQPTEAGAR
jgi:DNA-binding response OmpR family regulator